MSIVTLLQEQGYDYVEGSSTRATGTCDLDEVVLRDDLAAYLRSRYKNDGITEQEVENAIRVITQRTGGSPLPPRYPSAVQDERVAQQSRPYPLAGCRFHTVCNVH